MRGAKTTRRSRAAAFASAVAAIALAAACQAGPGTQESFAQGARGSGQARPPAPFKTFQDCFRTDRNVTAEPSRVVATCAGEVTNPGLANRKSSEIAALHLNVGLARLALAASDPSQAQLAQQVLNRGLEVGSPTLNPVIASATRTALAESYLYTGALEDLDRALTMLSPQPTTLPERRLVTRIYEGKVRQGGPQLEQNLDSWLSAARRFRDIAGAAGAPLGAAQEASDQVVRASSSLGDYWLQRADATRGNPSRRDEAILSLQRGVNALQDSADPAVQLRLGQAQLQMAGLQGEARSADFDCQQGRALPLTLEYARAAFSRATGEAALAGEGCALQALGRNDEAVRKFEAAVAAAGSNSSAADRLFELARAQRLTGNLTTATVNFDRARNLYLALPSDQRPTQKIAQVFFALGELRSASPSTLAQAHCDYEAAIAEDPSFARAYLEHGRFHYNQASKKWSSQVGTVCPNRNPALPAESAASRHSDVALANLLAAEEKARQSGDKATLSDALLYTSKVLTERGENAYFDSRGRSSVTLADQAVSEGGGEWRFREQACLARIRQGGREQLQTAEATRYCADISPNTSQNAALRGMYNLRMAQYYDSRNPTENYTRTLLLTNARDSFRAGRTMLQPVTAEDRALQALLAIGEGLVLRCNNLGDTDIAEAIKLYDDASVQAASNRLNDYGLQNCR